MKKFPQKSLQSHVLQLQDDNWLSATDFYGLIYKNCYVFLQILSSKFEGRKCILLEYYVEKSFSSLSNSIFQYNASYKLIQSLHMLLKMSHKITVLVKQ